MPRTVVIWDSVEADVKFFVVDRDLSHLDGKYVNSTETSDEDSIRICNLVYDEEGQQVTPFLDKFPTEEVRNGASVVVLGFLP
jgi:hypothetical protein